MVMIFAGGHISGGHFNPAVTLGIWLRGKCETKDVAPYMMFQIIGAVLAAFAAKLLKAGDAITPIQPATIPSLLAEFLFTFALVYVVLNVATAKGTSGNSFYGLAIGFTVLVGAFSVGNISGGAFNPAVATALSVLGLSSWSKIWIYLIADFGGAAVAAGAFKVLSSAERQTEEETAFSGSSADAVDNNSRSDGRTCKHCGERIKRSYDDRWMHAGGFISCERRPNQSATVATPTVEDVPQERQQTQAARVTARRDSYSRT
jgi:aquaporin Z